MPYISDTGAGNSAPNRMPIPSSAEPRFRNRHGSVKVLVENGVRLETPKVIPVDIAAAGYNTGWYEIADERRNARPGQYGHHLPDMDGKSR